MISVGLKATLDLGDGVLFCHDELDWHRTLLRLDEREEVEEAGEDDGVVVKNPNFLQISVEAYPELSNEDVVNRVGYFQKKSLLLVAGAGI